MTIIFVAAAAGALVTVPGSAALASQLVGRIDNPRSFIREHGGARVSGRGRRRAARCRFFTQQSPLN